MWHRESARIAQELAEFQASLSPEDAAIFVSGHRLSAAARTSLLAMFSREHVRAHGWRFADEPTPMMDVDAVAAADKVRAAGPRPCPPPRSMRVATILMDLWHHSSDPAFLLELEACVDGLTHGVNFLFNGSRGSMRFQRNHGSARRQPDVLRFAVEQAILRGHSVGPFSSPPWANLQVHPLGLVPKSSGGWRIAEDASAPRGNSVNTWSDDLPQSYERWSAVVDHFARMGEGCFFLQWDKIDAFRSVPLRCQDQHLTGFFVPQFGFAYSVNMPFGFASSAYIWKRYMDLFLLLLSNRLQVPLADLHSWVDDCLVMLPSCAAKSLAAFGELVRTARRYCFFLHPDKLFLARSVTYLGVTFDSVAGTLSIPTQKLAQIKQRLTDALSRRLWSRNLAQRLLGSLFHITKCLQPARAFLGRLIGLLRLSRDDAPFAPPSWALEDIRAWLLILEDWSGSSLARVRAPSTPPSLSFHVDAFGGSTSNQHAGVGLVCLTSGEFFMASFSEAQRELAHVESTFSTLILEFSAFIWLLCSFLDIRHRVVQIFCDNQGAIDVASKGYHAGPVMGGLCRLLSALCVNVDCRLIFSHIVSQDNLADELSRGSIPGFLSVISAQACSINPCRIEPRLPPAELCERLQCEFFYSR